MFDIKTGLALVAMVVAGVSAYYSFVIATGETVDALEARIAELEGRDPAAGPPGPAGAPGPQGPAGPPGPPGSVAALPTDAIVAFALPAPGDPDADPCPEGWERYRRADGRMLVGVGTHDGDPPLAPFAAGGARTHMLTVGEMPSHDHRIVNQETSAAGAHRHGLNIGSEDGNGGFEQGGRRADDFLSTEESGNHSHTLNGAVENTGGGRAHNNMPPYLALYFCRKL